MTKSLMNGLAVLSLGALALACPLTSIAAVSAKSMKKAQTANHSTSGAMAATKEALAFPLEERVANLKALGDVGYQSLAKLMFDKSATMEERWKAVTAAGRVGGEKSRPELERALHASEWFMRNAALVAMMQLDHETGLSWARQLLNDKALVVRAAAVDVIDGARDAQSTQLLWTKLYAKENYKRGQSLFIRRRIVEALADMETSGRESKFIALLGDKDSSLHAPAISALERLTRHSIGSGSEPTKVRKAAWEKWWNESQARR